MQDVLYNTNTEQKSGKIFECLKYRQWKGRQIKNDTPENDITVADIENSVLDAEEEELKDFLNGCNLPRDLKELEKKMAETVDLRKRMLRTSGNMVPKIFNFYWIDTQLVRFFRIRSFVINFNQNSLSSFRFFMISRSCIHKLTKKP